MPRVAKELSALEVKRLNEPGLHAVGGVSGLYLQVLPTGATTWVLRTMIGGRRRAMGLGGYPTVTLAQARDKAREAREKVESGVDPIAERAAAKSALAAQRGTEMTFDECARQFIESRSVEWRNGKHLQQWTNTLATYASPTVGKVQVRDITLAHVVKILEPIWTGKTETASRLRGRIESVLDWATVRGYRKGENPARWQGHLDKILAKPSKVTKVEHHAALPYNQVAGFMADLAKREGMAARALEVLILTATRSGEVRGATWEEIDIDGALWTVPASRMKAGKEHRVPLSQQVIEKLRALPRLADNSLVFPAPRGGVLSDMTMTAVMRRMGVTAVPHGFRSSFRDWAGETTAYPREVIEHALAHQLKDKAEAAYQRGDLLAKRARLMEAWSQFCSTSQPVGVEVVSIRGTA